MFEERLAIDLGLGCTRVVPDGRSSIPLVRIADRGLTSQALTDASMGKK